MDFFSGWNDNGKANLIRERAQGVHGIRWTQAGEQGLIDVGTLQKSSDDKVASET